MAAPSDLISIAEAAKCGIERVRRPIWSDPFDHLKIDILENGEVGPWLHLYSPFNKECNNRDPVSFLWGLQKFGIEIPCVVPYEGPLPGSKEYQKRVESFKGVLSR